MLRKQAQTGEYLTLARRRRTVRRAGLRRLSQTSLPSRTIATALFHPRLNTALYVALAPLVSIMRMPSGSPHRHRSSWIRRSPFSLTPLPRPRSKIRRRSEIRTENGEVTTSGSSPKTVLVRSLPRRWTVAWVASRLKPGDACQIKRNNWKFMGAWLYYLSLPPFFTASLSVTFFSLSHRYTILLSSFPPFAILLSWS